jgi:hypothetical protein
MSANEIETKAAAMGWSPKEKFRGDPSNWVDAETYVKRGEEVMPILKATNRQLSSELESTKSRLNELQTTVEESKQVIEELKNFNTAITKQKADEIRSQLIAELREAKRSGDVDREVELTDQLTEHKAAQAKAAEKPAEKLQVEKPAATPEILKAKATFDSWLAENPWYNTDPIKTGVANGVAQKLRSEGSELTGREFFEEVARQTEAVLDKSGSTRRVDKVEGGGRSSSGGGGMGGKSYADMPPEAQAGCEKFARSMTFGKGRLFENIEAYRANYASKYFERE